jgi:hypothetical protein
MSEFHKGIKDTEEEVFEKLTENSSELVKVIDSQIQNSRIDFKIIFQYTHTHSLQVFWK